MQRLFTEMDDSERLLPLQVGLDPTGTGSALVARNLVSFPSIPKGFHPFSLIYSWDSLLSCSSIAMLEVGQSCASKQVL